MAPTIHFVRHAQGFHNLSHEAEQLHDPDLTPLGLEQCANLAAHFPHHQSLTKLVASPMRRTLYTCLHAFGRNETTEADKSSSLLPITALPVFQEISLQPCDVGSPVDELAAEFAAKVDVSHVEPAWTQKDEASPYEPTLEKLLARGRQGRLALREIAGHGDDHIVVVTHGGILHFLTDDWHGVDEDQGNVLFFSSVSSWFL